MINYIKDYFQSVCEAYQLGNTESSYNPAIIVLLTKFGCKARDMSGERSGKAGENIDIKLWRGDDNTSETEPFAAVEVKKIGGIDKRALENIKIEAARYGNVILTDNLIWEFWRADEDKMYAGVKIIELEDNKPTLKDENIELFISLVEDFMLRDPAQIKSSNKLAEYMAIHAKTIRSVITRILKDDGSGQPLIDERQQKLPMFTELLGLYNKIKEDLRPLLTSRSFADMYAQTIVYGLFVARYNDADSANFDRYKAIGKLQEESPLLNRFFTHITSTGKTHPTLELVIDKLCTLYQICDISALLSHDGRGDTIVHFYEDFLTHYDPELRKALGVFYTPAPVVSYLVSAVDKILINDFNISGGLSSNETLQISVPSEPYQSGKKTLDTKEITVPRVAVLDPACGTGTFHAQIIRHIKNTHFSGGNAAFYENYIQEENGLLSRLIGFEIMMTSYVVAHLNIRRAIEETLGHTPETQLPTSVYLTNTLAPPNSAVERNAQISLFDFSATIAEEAYKADTWKARRPIKVIIGNPPYLAASTNPFDISAYKTEADGVTKLQEKNSKLLGDDYVKFFRFAEQIIEKNNEGILAFVSNNGFLDNPTFRGMRASLLRTFDKVYIVNLHGSANKQEVTPDGSKDENIFAIMQGVSLFVGVKTTANTDWATVCYADLWGLREHKFYCLENANFEFVELSPDSKMAYLIPFASDDNKEIYEKGVSIAELLPAYVSGIVSGNDEVAIALTRDELIRRMEIVKNATDEIPIRGMWGKFSGGQTARKIQDDVLSGGVIIHIACYPFDNHWTYYSGNSSGWMDRPREKRTMGQLLQKLTSPIGQNIGLVFGRTSREFFSPLVSKNIIATRLFSAMCERAYIAPLYLYSELDNTWTPNLDQEHLDKLTQNLTEKPSPLEIFDYCYGILYDPNYREKYNEFLKRDFPRVSVIENEEIFRVYVTAGERLRKLHLMQKKVPAALELDGTDLQIGAVKYKDGVLHFNANTRITGIADDVWSYRIGGYQVLDKWLKSHKGEMLTRESFEHICNVAGLLAETLRVQEGLRSSQLN